MRKPQRKIFGLTKRELLNSFRIALIVGTILTLINQYDVIFISGLKTRDFVKIVLNYIVPFSVASYSKIQLLNK